MNARLYHHLASGPPRLPGGYHVLGGVSYGAFADHTDAPVLTVPMPMLDGSDGAGSLLVTDVAPRTGECGAVRYAATDELMFGVLTLPESKLTSAAETAYSDVFGALDALGYPTLLRAWNYMPDINAASGGVERYRQFNAGRQAAFAASGRPVSGRVPAACALGMRQGPLSIAFLASVTPFVPVENPRQVSAYHYPRDYGDRSPTFSRAGLARVGGVDALFVSGTAAIVGHASMHAGDIDAQMRETLINLDAVVTAAGAYPGAIRHRLEDLDFIAYVRHAGDASKVLSALRHRVGENARVICVQADVCRAELLVEIEAVGGLPKGEFV